MGLLGYACLEPVERADCAPACGMQNGATSAASSVARAYGDAFNAPPVFDMPLRHCTFALLTMRAPYRIFALNIGRTSHEAHAGAARTVRSRRLSVLPEPFFGARDRGAGGGGPAAVRAGASRERARERQRRGAHQLRRAPLQLS